MAGKHTEEELALLTEEERAGLLEGEEPSQPEEDKPAPAAADAAEPEKVEEPAPAAQEAPQPANAAPEQAKVDASAEEPERPRAAVPDWTAPADAKEKLADIDKREAELDGKFDNGEVTQKQYREALRVIEAERRAIEEARLKADIAAETRAAVWAQQTVSAFLDRHTIYKDNETLFAALDVEVRKLQASAQDPFAPSILTKAHAKVQSAFHAIGGKVEEPKAKVEEPKPAGKPAPVAPDTKIEVKPRDPIPPSLAKVPASDPESLDGGKFALLSRLADTNYLEFEAAFSKLSDADKNAYLAGA
jgi:hypothetical protein